MIIITEDSRKTSTLAEVYTWLYDKVIFSNGNRQLILAIESALNSSKDEIIVYVDVVPDNYQTLFIFNHLLNCYKDEKRVFILPIFCSEYCVLCALSELGRLNSDAQLLIDFPSLRSATKYKKIVGSLEKLFKQALRDHKREYIQANNGFFVSREEFYCICICKHSAFADAAPIHKYRSIVDGSYQSILLNFISYFVRQFPALHKNIDKQSCTLRFMRI